MPISKSKSKSKSTSKQGSKKVKKDEQEIKELSSAIIDEFYTLDTDTNSYIPKENYKYLCCKLIKSYLNQYLIILKYNFKLKKIRSIILSGGIPKKIPVIKEYLNQKSLLKIYVKKNKIDETLLGLKSIIKT